MKKIVRKIRRLAGGLVEKVKANPVRALSFGLSAATAALAYFGVTDGTLVEVLGQIGLLLGGGEAVRAKVTPETKAAERAERAYELGRRQRR